MPLELVSDECVTREGTTALAALLSLYDPPVPIEFLLDVLGKGKANADGVWDENWAPMFKGTGKTILTKDRGRSNKKWAKGPPLHLVLPREKVTGVFLSGGLAQAKKFEVVRAIACVLPDIFSECPRATPGTRFRLSQDRGHFELTEWPMKKGESSAY